tara:strand:- start:1616 stop:1798 length:183 start_codon:yes stop_codon:yes gene_type:complete
MGNYSVNSKPLTKSNMVIPVNRGKIIIQATFPLRNDKKKQLKSAIEAPRSGTARELQRKV